jgi:hypothetical protein
MTGTQLRNMPSTFEYITEHMDRIFFAWGSGYIYNVAIFVIVPAAVWWISEEIGTISKQEKVNANVRRELIAMLVFEAVLLIPISLRQPLPYYVMPLLLCISFMIAAVPIVKLAGINKLAVGAVIIGLCAVSISQVRSAVLVLDNNHQVSFNKLIAGELYDLGVRDSAEVLNLVAPFELYWPYGNKSPLLYYTLKEPGWLSLTNTLGQKRPFIYKMTKGALSRFRIVLARPVSTLEKDQFLSGFELAKQIGGVQIYKSTAGKD